MLLRSPFSSTMLNTVDARSMAIFGAFLTRLLASRSIWRVAVAWFFDPLRERSVLWPCGGVGLPRAKYSDRVVQYLGDDGLHWRVLQSGRRVPPPVISWFALSYPRVSLTTSFAGY
jgi:hypothetical protein